MKKLLAFSLAAVVCGGIAFAHFCNNVYRTPGRLIIKPENPLTKIRKRGSVRIFLKNNFPYYFRNVRLRGECDSLQVEVEPPSIPEIAPGEIVEFTVKVERLPRTKPGDYKVKIYVNAANWENRERLAADVSIPDLKNYLSGARNSYEKLVGYELLALKGDPEGFAYLENELSRMRMPLSAMAAYALGMTRSQRGVQALISALGSRPDEPQLLAAMAWALGFSGQKSAKSALSTLSKSSDSSVAVSALAGLALLGDRTVKNKLEKALQARDFMARLHAASALAYLGSDDGREMLKRCMQERDWVLKTYTGRVMLCVAELTGGGAETGSVQDFLKLPTSKRVKLMRKWEEERDTSAVPLLIQVLKESKRYTTRASAARVLGKIGSPDALEALKQAAENDTSPTVRAAAKKAIEAIEAESNE